AAAEEARRYRYAVLVTCERLNRRARGDLSEDLDLDRLIGVGRCRIVGIALEIAANDRRREFVAVRRRRIRGLTALRNRRLFRQTHDFERAGAMGQAADEAALLKAADQPVNAGFRFEVE